GAAGEISSGKPIVAARIYHLEMRKKHSHVIVFEPGLGVPRLTHAPNPGFESANFLLNSKIDKQVVVLYDRP
ncbi:MAG: hypothetical protein VB060_09155, partial [Oscillibacter sp.]